MQAAEPLDDFVITFAPDATPEEEERFLTELAHAIIAVAKHLVDQEDLVAAEQAGETSDSEHTL
ncbi:MAG: hypothetical protein ABJC13_07650 [Acidobacteriota bacterium]